MRRQIIVMLVLATLLLGIPFGGLFVPAAQAQAPPLPAIVDPLYVNPIADPMAIPKFVNPLPIPGRIDMTAGGSMDMYMEETYQDLGLLGPNPTTPLLTKVWGYGDQAGAVSYPGPTLVAEKDTPINIDWWNDLGYSHPLPVDPYVHYTFSHPPYEGYTISDLGVPAVPHLHGGHTESESDGLPEAWWTPAYHGDPANPLYKGMDFVKSTYTYDNDQEAATLWYHDHALGITRLNVYMGLAGFYLLRDPNEENLIASNSIPSGAKEIELVIQDRMFYPDGQLAYPDVPAVNMPGFLPWPGGPSAQPEFFGDVILVNGKAWPVLDVEPSQYRFRFLNGSDSRFYDMWMTAPVNTTAPLRFTQIGTEDGLMPVPVDRRKLLIGPGERYDVVVDFSDPALLGQTIILRNNAKAPFPKGTTVDPNTSGQIMAFRVGSTPVVDPVTLPATLRPDIAPLVQDGATRQLLLFEAVDEFGRLKPMLGTTADGVQTWVDPITENPMLDDVEVWEIYNTTMDAHPIHLHLVAFQVQSRQKFTAAQDPVTGALTNISLKGKQRAPDPTETGWKDTVIMYPGEVTRVIAKFDRPGLYVWHCHILSHEDHEMMRPYYVGAMAP